jgi:uncharacterized protein involved in exopolysaccharide biosynthesis
MTAHFTATPAGSIDDGSTVLASFMRTSIYLAVITAIIVVVTYAVLAQLAPRYRAEATVLIDPVAPRSQRIDSGEPAAGGLRRDVGAQLQLLRSRDLARTVTQSLGLERRPAAVSALDSGSILADVLSGIGLRRDPTRISREERILDSFAAHLSAYVLDDAPVIAIGFTSGDPRLSADIANAVATEYVALQKAAPGGTVEDATTWLEAEIAGLRRHIGAIEARIEAYRGGIGRLSDAGPPIADPARQQRAAAQLGDGLRELENEAARQRDLLDSYVERYGDVLVRRQSGFLPVDARILSPAAAPLEPFFPRKGPITAIIGALALLAMLVFVVVRELARGRRRHRVRLVPLPEVVDAMPIRVKAARWGDDRGPRRMMPAVPTFADVEVDGRIGDVTDLSHKLISCQSKRIMVVTVGDEVGKRRPLTAVALARGLARADRRPVLIDLRDDGADSLSMGEAADLPGFSDLFAGEASFGQVIFRDRKSRVHFIPAGLRRLSRQDLSDGRVGLLVNALDHTYDHVVFDVASNFVEAIGSECDVAVLASDFDRNDPRTVALVRRVRLSSQAKIVVVRVDPEETPEPGFEVVVGDAAA